MAATAADQGRQVAATAIDSGQDVAGAALERGHQVADVARRDASAIAGTAREQAAEVGDELRHQVQELFDEARSQLETQRDVQTERLAEGLRRLGAEALALADGRPDESGTVGEYVWQCADRLDEWADSLDTMGIDGVVDEITSFARRRPGAFILGAALAGFGIGRLLRSSTGAAADENENRPATGTNGSGAGKRRAPTGTRPRPAIALEPR